MDTELRPLSLGEILDRVFQLYRSHFLMFAGISTVAAGLDLVWKLIQTGILRSIQHHVAAQTLGFSSAGLSIINFVVYIVASAVATAAINRAVSAIYLGKQTGITEAFIETRPHWLRYVGLYIVAALLAWGAAIVIFFGVVIAGAVIARGSAVAGAIMAGVFGLSLLVLIPFGVWMTLRYSLANPACVFEDLGIRASLKRSIFLSKGATEKSKIFTLLFLAWIISLVLTSAVSIPIIVVTLSAHASLSLGMTLYALLAGFVTTSVTTPIYAIGLTLFYYDARIRKEGFDIEWMMQRATPAPPLPTIAPDAPPAESPLG
jgi:hypothetical protein